MYVVILFLKSDLEGSPLQGDGWTGLDYFFTGQIDSLLAYRDRIAIYPDRQFDLLTSDSYLNNTELLFQAFVDTFWTELTYDCLLGLRTVFITLMVIR